MRSSLMPRKMPGLEVEKAMLWKSACAVDERARKRGSEGAIQQEAGVLVLVMVGALVLARDRRIARDIEIDRSIEGGARATRAAATTNSEAGPLVWTLPFLGVAMP